MIRFVISSERFADACSVPDYLGVLLGRMGNQMNVLPRMIVAVGEVELKDKEGKVLRVAKDGEYIVEVVTNSDGDVIETKYVEQANKMLDDAGITPRRFEKLRKELTEAARNIVNPPNGRDSNGQ